MALQQDKTRVTNARVVVNARNRLSDLAPRKNISTNPVTDEANENPMTASLPTVTTLTGYVTRCGNAKSKVRSDTASSIDEK